MPGKGRTIIHIVDDDEAVRESLEALLFAFGFEAETYGSAEDYLANKLGDGACLILDVNMPGMSGFDLLHILSDQDRRTPTIVLTANPDNQLPERARQLGAVAVLTKPVTNTDLLDAIASATEGR